MVMSRLISQQDSSPPTDKTVKPSGYTAQLVEHYPGMLLDESWLEMINECEIRSFPAGMRLMQPFSICENFYLFVEGRVRVYQHTPDDRELTLYRLQAGDLCVLSINALLRDQPFSAFAVTETISHAIEIPYKRFMQAMSESEGFCRLVLVNLTDRCNDLIQLTEQMVFNNLDSRLICHLSRLSRTLGTQTLHLTHQDLARELASSREVISRVLKSLQQQGCIEVGRGVIQLLH